MINKRILINRKGRSLLRSKPILFFLSPKFKNPKINFREKIQNLKLTFKFEMSWLLLWFLIFVADSLISLIFKTKPVISSITSNYQGLRSMKSEQIILLAVIIGPVLEEIAFRGFMNFKKYMICLSVSVLIYSFYRIFFRITIEWWVILTILVIIFFFTYYLLWRWHVVHDYLIAKRIVIFYSMSVLFALAHLSNFAPGTFRGFNFLLIPCIVFPQFIASISLAYIRLKNGLAWSIALHSIVNLCVVGMYILARHMHT